MLSRVQNPLFSFNVTQYQEALCDKPMGRLRDPPLHGTKCSSKSLPEKWQFQTDQAENMDTSKLLKKTHVSFVVSVTVLRLTSITNCGSRSTPSWSFYATYGKYMEFIRTLQQGRVVS